ncbi:twin-arginine translocase TatA/TatE family subunit [Aquihabitans daechungensis]|uniref:twin-arginine translocase TatA/TatE family subunit n=1 Tax=Aquihabitans daechungensis TaxID=1052257 RepID=UPI003BA11CC7
MPLGPTELIIVLVIVLVLFGGAKLPKLAKSLGEAQREFKKGQDDAATDATAASTPSTPASPIDSDKPADSGPVA